MTPPSDGNRGSAILPTFIPLFPPMALLEFYGEECPHCKRMEPHVERLRKEGHAIESYETWHDEKNAAMLAKYDRGLCGGVPFFFNTDSGKHVCGAVGYDELKAWAEGK